jgi:hypothetical protein
MTEMKFSRKISVYTGKCDLSYNRVVPILRYDDVLGRSKISLIFNLMLEMRGEREVSRSSRHISGERALSATVRVAPKLFWS